MDTLDSLIAELRSVLEQLMEPALEPDPKRAASAEARTRAEAVDAALETRVLAPLQAALQGQDAEVQEAVRSRVAGACAGMAAVLHALGERDRVHRRLSRGAELAAAGAQRAELEAGGREPATFARLQHARWLWAHGETRRARGLLRALGREAVEPALREAARQVEDAPRPLKRAPSLYTLNGFGVGLYGKRDRREDGSYIATTCVCALFVPVLPLAAYRVQDAPGGGWHFFSRERLSPFARVTRAAVLVLAVGAGAAGGTVGYLRSPGRLAQVALEEGRSLEAAGEQGRALERYESAAREDGGRTASASPAAEAWLQLKLARLAQPCTPGALGAATALVDTWGGLPVHPAAADGRLAARVVACAEEAAPGAAEQALALLERARTVRLAGEARSAVETAARRAHLALGQKLAADAPLAALPHLLAAAQDAAALDAAHAVLRSFAGAPSLWVEAAPAVEQWMNMAAAVPARASDVAWARAALEAARTAQKHSEALVAEGDEAKLRAALRASPGDQVLAAAVAARLREQGKSHEALALLLPLGGPGRLTGDARVLRGALHADLGQLEEADTVLSGYLAEHLTAYRESRARYQAAVERAEQRLMDQARNGRLPADIDSRLERAAEADRPEVFRTWAVEQLDRDAELTHLREDALRHEGVVGATLLAGTVKLRRAQAATGEARSALLAEAEQAFLSIRGEAQGAPTFHLGLGTVYHRLGKHAEGDREFETLLARKDDALSLKVAEAYRELLLMPQAQRVAEAVYEGSKDVAARQSAAVTLYQLATTPEQEEMWLKRGDTSSSFVRQSLLELEGQRHLREGRLAEADRAFARVASEREKVAKHQPVAANNAAIAYMRRYQATGDVAHLRTAVRLLETAARQKGDSALVLGNLASAQEYLGMVTVLEGRVRTRALRLDAGEAMGLVEVLLEGRERDALLAALDRDAAHRRAVQLVEQEQVLAPQAPESYEPQLRWLQWHGDGRGLAALRQRLEALPPVDADVAARDRHDFLSGERDAELKALRDSAVATARARVEQVRGSRHGPTLAAAWMLLGRAQDRRNAFDATPEALAAAVEAYREAVKAWPGAGLEEGLARALVTSAFHRARAEVPALEEAWKREGRVHGLPMLLARQLAGPQRAAVQAALARAPELREALALSQARLSARPGPTEWVLAQLVGTPAQQAAAAAVFARTDLRDTLAIEARLAPGQERERVALAFVERKGQLEVAGGATP